MQTVVYLLFLVQAGVADRKTQIPLITLYQKKANRTLKKEVFKEVTGVCLLSSKELLENSLICRTPTSLGNFNGVAARLHSVVFWVGHRVFNTQPLRETPKSFAR